MEQHWAESQGADVGYSDEARAPHSSSLTQTRHCISKLLMRSGGIYLNSSSFVTIHQTPACMKPVGVRHNTALFLTAWPRQYHFQPFVRTGTDWSTSLWLFKGPEFPVNLISTHHHCRCLNSSYKAGVLNSSTRIHLFSLRLIVLLFIRMSHKWRIVCLLRLSLYSIKGEILPSC